MDILLEKEKVTIHVLLDINDKTSELVKILQLLKNKFGGGNPKPSGPSNSQKPGAVTQTFPSKQTQEKRKEEVKQKAEPTTVTATRVEK